MTDDFTDSAKAALRARVRHARAARSVAEREDAGRTLAARVMALPTVVSARSIALYSAMASEPDTAPLLRLMWADGRQVLLPRVTGNALEWVSVTSDLALAPGAFGIPEPVGGSVVSATAADVVVIPALAVDRTGARLGQGGGYYDRALVEVTAPVIALVFDDEIVDAVPTSAHDRRVDIVVTPTRTVDFS